MSPRETVTSQSPLSSFLALVTLADVQKSISMLFAYDSSQSANYEVGKTLPKRSPEPLKHTFWAGQCTGQLGGKGM